MQPENSRRIRPKMPHYGIDSDLTDSMLSWDWVEKQMTAARNFWVCTTRPDGRPHAVPIWGAWVDGYFYFGTDLNSVKTRNIKRDNRVVIHLESGDDTLIFEGNLVEAQLSESLESAINAVYRDKYDFDPESDETEALTYRLIPRKVMAWLESDYPNTATNWLFDV